MISRPFIILVSLQFVSTPLKMWFLARSRQYLNIQWDTLPPCSMLGLLTWELGVRGVCQLLEINCKILCDSHISEERTPRFF